jgi:hypothetical protein
LTDPDPRAAVYYILSEYLMYCLVIAYDEDQYVHPAGSRR